jgi:hypothetical protein
VTAVARDSALTHNTVAGCVGVAETHKRGALKEDDGGLGKEDGRGGLDEHSQ